MFLLCASWAMLLHRQECSGAAQRVGEVHHSRARRDGRLKRGEDLGVGGRRRELHFLHHKPEAFGLPHPGLTVAAMLEGAEQDFVPRLQIKALAKDRVAFGGVARDRHLVHPGAQESSRFEPDLLLSFLEDIAVLVRIDGHEAPVFSKSVIHGTGRRAQRPRVEIGEARLHHELLPNLLPIAVIVGPVLPCSHGLQLGRVSLFDLSQGGGGNCRTAQKTEPMAPRDVEFHNTAFTAQRGMPPPSWEQATTNRSLAVAARLTHELVTEP